MGKWAYGYTTFALDLTEQACFGDTPNVLAVRVNREQVADSRWFTGTGIYRKVRLVLQDPVCLARNGVFFTTPEVDAAQARFQVACTVCNTCLLYTSHLRLYPGRRIRVRAPAV